VAGRLRAAPRGILFALIAAGLLAIAYEGVTGGEWIVAAAAALLAGWMADLAARDLGLRRRR
jgi:hypothetical protein